MTTLLDHQTTAQQDLDAELAEIARGDGLEAAQVGGVQSGQWILERLLEAAAREADRGDHHRASRLLAKAELVGAIIGDVIDSLDRRVAVRARVRGCNSQEAVAELACYERREARVWKSLAPVRARLREALANGTPLAQALSVAMPAVDRLARRDLVRAHARLDRVCRTTNRHARSPRRHVRARTTRRRRSAASRARPSSDGDGGEPPRRRTPTTIGGAP